MSIDLIGKKRLYSGNFKYLRIIDKMAICQAVSAPRGNETTLVTGHDWPDADSIVSAVFEATRRSILSPWQTCLPCADSLPKEVSHVLGIEIASHIAPINLKDIGPQNTLVLVDCHEIHTDHTHAVRSIIDHHIVNTTFPYHVAKISGCGMDPDAEAAKILAEATKLEAEPSLWKYMSELDRLCMQRLEAIAGSTANYADLMSIMTDVDTSEEQKFYRDYKESTFGFAVVKANKCCNYDSIAKSNNFKKGLPLTVVEQVVYDHQFSQIYIERISMVFDERSHDKGFRSAVMDIVSKACMLFHGEAHVSRESHSVLVKDVRMQTPRLLLMPLMEEIVKEHLKFAYSRAIDRYISCGFLCGSSEKYGFADETAEISRLSFVEAKTALAKSSNTSFMSLPQYWKVYEEFNSRNDNFVVKSLRDKTHVELLDTIILNKSIVQNGASKEIAIAEAAPALIRPKDCSHITGIPFKMHSPDNNGDDSLWRYWSPDCNANVATRGIFSSWTKPAST